MKKKIFEALANLEHEQWMEWSKNVAKTEELNGHPLSKDRIMRWKKYWKPYARLPEDVKEFDRIWVGKVLDILKIGSWFCDKPNPWTCPSCQGRLDCRIETLRNKPKKCKPLTNATIAEDGGT